MKKKCDKDGFLLLECIVSIFIITIILGFVLSISVHLIKECRYICRSMVQISELSSVCDAFVQDFLQGGSAKIKRITSQEIMWCDGEKTTSWILAKDGLRKVTGNFDQIHNEWKNSKKTLVSRNIAEFTLEMQSNGCVFGIKDRNGQSHKRYIKKIV